MNAKLRWVLSATLALVFLFSSGNLIRLALDEKASERAYGEAMELANLSVVAPITTGEPEMVKIEEIAEHPVPLGQTAVIPADQIAQDPQPAAEVLSEPLPQSEPQPEPEPVWVDPYADALKNMDFTALRQENQDVAGWILIPDTKVSYPLMQGEDNDYYLNHNWRRQKSSQGSIYMDYRCSTDLSGFHTILYGHKMNNGAMFGQLYRYEEQTFWEAHPNLYIADDNGSHVYQIFAAYEASVSTGDTYRVSFASEEKQQAFLDACMEHSEIQTGIVPTVEDRILTLSTCTGNGHATRWVVQAVYQGTTAQEGTK